MASQVGGDLTKIKSGPCKISFDEGDGHETVGHTMEGIRFNVQYDLRKRMVDEYGTNTAQMIHQGENIEISTTLAETTLKVISIVFAWGYQISATMWGWGRTPGLDGDDVGKELLIHPLAMLADTAEDVTFWKTVPSNAAEVQFGVITADRVYGITFTAMIDESRSNGYLLGRIGIPA